MKRKGFILMEVLLALLLLSALAGNERSRFCCRFRDREDTE